MAQGFSDQAAGETLPGWVPQAVRLYLEHTEAGLTLRALARASGCHASTVLRQVRKTESRRDDPLVDAGLSHLGQVRRRRGATFSETAKDARGMTDPIPNNPPVDNQTLEREALRVLRALMRPGAVMAVMREVETAVVVSGGDDDGAAPRQLAKCTRDLAEALAVKDWIACARDGKVARYRITAAGRAALNRMLAERESQALGFAEAPANFVTAPGAAGMRAGGHDNARPAPRRGRRGVGAETPIRVLGRRLDRNRKPYLDPELVAAAERIQRDFELAAPEGNAATADWESLMSGYRPGPGAGLSRTDRRIDARSRLESALHALGPEMGEVVLSVCCHEQGMEAVEKRHDMPARSGKFMLRIALRYLQRHYLAQGGNDHDLIY